MLIPLMLMPLLRTAQTMVPGIRAAKFDSYNLATKYLGWRIDPEFHLLRKMPGINLAVDVGGNWGQSILALQHVCNPQKIISFEPNPVLAQRLMKKFATEESVSVLNQAVSEAQGTLKLYIPSYNGYIFDGLASLDYESARGWLNSERMFGFRPESLSIDSVEVSSVNLDSFDLSPDVLKVDVQGLEYQVLRGGVDTLRRSHPVTIIEAPTPEVTSFMAEVGMEPFSVIEGKIEKGLHDTVNTVFLSRDKQLVLADQIS